MEKKKDKKQNVEAVRVGEGALPYLPREESKESKKSRFARIRKHLSEK